MEQWDGVLGCVSTERYVGESAEIVKRLREYRDMELAAVTPFMNGDFTRWDLYLAATCEYCMRLIDGVIPMLESRNFICVEQLLRAQIGVCMRTFALVVCNDADEFLEVFFAGGRVDKVKDRKGKNLTDGRLKELLSEYAPTVKDDYDMASGFTHYSFEVIMSMSVRKEGCAINLNFGAPPNEEVNSMLLGCGRHFLGYLDLHLQMLKKVVEADTWYKGREKV